MVMRRNAEVDLKEQLRARFVELYGEARSDLMRIRAAHGDKPAAQGGQTLSFPFGPDEFPEEDIDRESVVFLTETDRMLRKVLSTDIPEAPTAETAAAILLSRCTLTVAESYLWRTILFLSMDRRYHPDAKVRLDARALLSAEAYHLPNRLDVLARLFAMGDALFDGGATNLIAANELRILQLSANLFFDTFDSVFGLKAVRKCRVGFDQMMRTMGTKVAIDLVPNYLRRHKTMYREICAAQENGGVAGQSAAERTISELSAKVSELQEAVAANTSAVASSARAVANFDRRQKTFLEGLKKLIGGFVRLFRPSAPVPTREQVAVALKQKQDRYACLDRITNAVHRSQLKEVIDYTLKHPIVHHGRTRDDFTLANAARAVWNTRHAIWEKVPGSFETFNQLKAACYNLQQAKDDPFAYQAGNR